MHIADQLPAWPSCTHTLACLLSLQNAELRTEILGMFERCERLMDAELAQRAAEYQVRLTCFSHPPGHLGLMVCEEWIALPVPCLYLVRHRQETVSLTLHCPTHTMTSVSCCAALSMALARCWQHHQSQLLPSSCCQCPSGQSASPHFCASCRSRRGRLKMLSRLVPPPLRLPRLPLRLGPCQGASCRRRWRPVAAACRCRGLLRSCPLSTFWVMRRALCLKQS